MSLRVGSPFTIKIEQDKGSKVRERGGGGERGKGGRERTEKRIERREKQVLFRIIIMYIVPSKLYMYVVIYVLHVHTGYLNDQ